MAKLIRIHQKDWTRVVVEMDGVVLPTVGGATVTVEGDEYPQVTLTLGAQRVEMVGGEELDALQEETP